jgi:hypothetical protein
MTGGAAFSGSEKVNSSVADACATLLGKLQN